MLAAEVKLENVGKRYGPQWVIRQLSLHIQRGDFYTLLGPSGCGKTTLLRMIAGFAVPDEGTIWLDDYPVQNVPPWRRDVGMVFQNYALWPHLTVFENVAFGLRERKIRRSEIARRVSDALKQVDLAGAENRRPSQLSGGQQQRVALARTLVIQPRVLLLDEPLSNLDAKLRVEMRIELLKLQRDLGLTTIYVTHDQEEALAMSTRIAVIDRGRIVQEGAPREIYERPAQEFVAAFVGQANLFSARVLRQAEQNLEVKTDSGCVLKIAYLSAEKLPKPTERILFSVRPEAMLISQSSGDGIDINKIPAQVAAAVYQGSFVEYEVLAMGQAVKVRVANPKSAQLFPRGAQVTISFSPGDAVVIPALDAVQDSGV